MWTIWWINWQIVKITVSCKIFVLTSTYLLLDILQKNLSITDIIPQNCRTSHLTPLTVNVIQMVTQSVQSISARQLIYCELLYWQRGTKNWVSLTCLNICACTSNTFCEAQNSQVPHKDVSVKDGSHIRRWSHNTGCFKKSFTTLKAYRNLYRGHTQHFELSKYSKPHRVYLG
jgi:hypothetical protein